MDVSLAGMQKMQINANHLWPPYTQREKRRMFMWSMQAETPQRRQRCFDHKYILSLYSAVIKLCVCVFSYFPLTDRSVAAPTAADVVVITGCIVEEVVWFSLSWKKHSTEPHKKWNAECIKIKLDFWSLWNEILEGAQAPRGPSGTIFTLSLPLQRGHHDTFRFSATSVALHHYPK